MNIWDFLVFAYVVVLVVGAILSFVLGRQPHRRNIRIATAVLATPILGFLVLGGLLWFAFDKEPPTLVELQHDFPKKQVDLETILRMSDQDSDFSRIAPDFLDRDSDGLGGPGRFMQEDPKAGLPQSRWNEYRRIYSKNDIKLGIQRDAARDAFIMVDSVGLLNRGHVTGYVYCVEGSAPGAYRFHPCMSHEDSGERKFSSNPREEAYKFQRVEGQWYVYDEGPS